VLVYIVKYVHYTDVFVINKRLDLIRNPRNIEIGSD
jgi:hypothetical protein